MTDSLTFVIDGTDADATAARIAAALATAFGTPPTVRRCDAPPDGPRRALDPIAVAALIVSIPAAVLATVDLMERRKKKSDLDRLIETLRPLLAGRSVCIRWESSGGSMTITDLSTDALLTLGDRASAQEESP